MTRRLMRLVVRRAPGARSRGVLVAGALACPCALGRSGITRTKREGDGATPAGRLRLIQAFYRGMRPRLPIPARPIRPFDGWCDDPASPLYNRPVRLPHPARHEAMRRDDHLYDLVVDLAHNRGPIVKGRGSAIFLHVARPGFLPTEGCVALRAADLRRLLPRLSRRTVLEVR